jgi:protein SCO1/2
MPAAFTATTSEGAMLKVIRIVAWSAVALVALVAGLVALGIGPKLAPSQLPLQVSFGGPFTMTDHNGQRFGTEQMKGRPYALFFGFTHCPDVCPTSLMDLTGAIERLGSDADKIEFLFVTVDPARDTPAQLKDYLTAFDKRIRGLVGTESELADVAQKFRAYYKKQPTKDGYTMDHTATTYLMDRNGRLAGTLAYQEKIETVVEKLRRLTAS